MSNPRSAKRSLEAVWLALAGAAILLRLWFAWCAFPASPWNDLRLEPTFMLREGATPYPGIDGGPLTTWIYGPVSLLLFLPATLTSNVVSALMVAGGLNLLVSLIPAVIAVRAWSRPEDPVASGDWLWALLLCLTIWPNSSLRFIQADDTVVACGLFAILLLIRAKGPKAGRCLAGAALATALAAWSKQTAIVLVIAQAAWLAMEGGPRVAGRYLAFWAMAMAALGMAWMAWFGREALWLNLVQVPAALPYAGNWFDRVKELAPHLVGYVLAPAVLALVAGRRIWRTGSPWNLPMLSWLVLLPGGILAAFKLGGSANSLSGFLFLMPVATIFVVRYLRPRIVASGPMLLALVVAGTAAQLASEPSRNLVPAVAHLRRAQYLADQFRGQIYFPWNPMVTYFSDRRFYHVEDGLFVRLLAGHAQTPQTLQAGLPSPWLETARVGQDGGWGIIDQLQPRDAQRSQYGEWTLDLWPEPVPLPELPAPGEGR